MEKFLLFVVSALVLAGCTTPYQKAGTNGFQRTGYEEVKISNDKYRVKYLDTDSMLAYKRFLKRSAELTLENCYSFFKIIDKGEMRESDKGIMVRGTGFNSAALPQYEATIQLYSEKVDDVFDAKTIQGEKQK